MLQFSTRDDLQNTVQFDPAIENLIIVWTFIFEAAGSKVEGSISYYYRFQIGTRRKSELSPNNRCNFFSMLAVKFIG